MLTDSTGVVWVALNSLVRYFMKTKRKEALELWRNLSKKQKTEMAKKHFQDMDSILIETSSNRIERIYKREFTVI